MLPADIEVAVARLVAFGYEEVEMYWTLVVLAVVAAVALICVFMVRRRMHRVRAHLVERGTELELVRTEANRAEERAAAELDAERARTTESLSLLGEAKRGLRDSIGAACQQALEANGRSFLQLAQANGRCQDSCRMN